MDLSTDSGILAVWEYSSFSDIHDYNSWDKELCEDQDISRHIQSGNFVPLDLGDGAFRVDLRIGAPDSMSEREREYLLVLAQPYRLKTAGKIGVSGIEYVSGDISSNVLAIELPAGEYSIVAHLIDWFQEPGAVDASGGPTENALPDLIVYIDQPAPGESYRTELETFRKEDALR